MGFSLEMADQVYYQPAPWRRAGLNLFLPFGFELAPRIDTDDSLPIVQRMMVEADSPERRRRLQIEEQPRIVDCRAVLWSMEEGQLRELRVADVAPLHEEFQLLNQFQRQVATRVADTTRARLEQSVRTAQARVGENLDVMASDLLTYLRERTGQLVGRYNSMSDSLTQAEQDVAHAEASVQAVTELLARLPATWSDFLEAVLRVHDAVTRPQARGWREVQERHAASVETLRQLTGQQGDLLTQANRRREQVTEHVEQCRTSAGNAQQTARDLDALTTRASDVVQSVQRLHQRLQQRLQSIQNQEQLVGRMRRILKRSTSASGKLKRSTIASKSCIGHAKRRTRISRADVLKCPSRKGSWRCALRNWFAVETKCANAQCESLSSLPTLSRNSIATAQERSK